MAAVQTRFFIPQPNESMNQHPKYRTTIQDSADVEPQRMEGFAILQLTLFRIPEDGGQCLPPPDR